MNDWDDVKEERWYKDQVRLYNHLNDLSRIALTDLDFIGKTSGSQSIVLTDEERMKRVDKVKQVRAIFKKLDPCYTQVVITDD